MDNTDIDYAGMRLGKWSKEQDDQLHILYNIDKLTLIEIYKKMMILPWIINRRLYEKKYIDTITGSRGYNEYVESSLYTPDTPEYHKMVIKMSGIMGDRKSVV